jgi:putative transposon-encoded protein
VSRAKIELTRERLHLHDEIDGFFEKSVTKFGNGAKIDCPKEFLGRRVYVIVCKEGEEKEEK